MRMPLFHHHFLRILVVLLVSVFMANTVYAGSMYPVTAEAMSEHDMAHHCHEQADTDQHYSEHHQTASSQAGNQAEHQSQSHGGSHCHHCMACYSMILDVQPEVASVSSKPVLAVTVNVLYLAPVNPQPSKPPIL